MKLLGLSGITWGYLRLQSGGRKYWFSTLMELVGNSYMLKNHDRSQVRGKSLGALAALGWGSCEDSGALGASEALGAVAFRDFCGVSEAILAILLG